MNARVKQDARWKIVTAFGGIEYNQREYVKVPEGFEQAARTHEFLEIEPEGEPEPIEPKRRAHKPKKEVADD